MYHFDQDRIVAIQRGVTFTITIMITTTTTTRTQSQWTSRALLSPPSSPSFRSTTDCWKTSQSGFFVQEYNHPHFSFHFMSTFSASTGGWFRQSRKKLSKRVRSRHRHHFCTNQRFPLCKGCFIKLSFLPWNLLNILATSTAHTS